MTTEFDMSRAEAFVEQAATDVGAAFGTLLAYVGDRLGLWEALGDGQPATPADLAERTGTHERMVREWLAAQAAGGYVEYDPGTATFSLPVEHAFMLTNPATPFEVAALFQLFMACARDVDVVLEAFKTGKGLGWSAHHPELFHAIERGFGAMYRTSLVTEWVPAVEGLEDRLREGATVADVGCGHGVSTVVMAAAFPASTFVGFDSHAPSIERARKLAAEEGVGDRVRFEVATAQAFPGHGYDVVCLFDCLHDMGDPLGAARHAREALSDGGVVMLVEPLAADRLEDNLHPRGRMMYGGSTLACVPCSLDEDGPALGGQAGEARLRAIFDEAGFARFQRAAETPFSLILEARP